ncbi:hypothetical protein AC482_00330 [miscellaneous Crenarchaeota group-15 archaeon DG-45]|uniref:Uncharacterized protein n=1 Tax=miscellaneous Crenarchaeota group-15 archaeon DG-45 TaxID=1685127 RepID=A0A0M0BSJ4_9ARCH|nr:MAG: hypothetical protein AC482_00330 [miscellaneous Crenarchaeota group-15 archaeon DG-45]
MIIVLLLLFSWLTMEVSYPAFEFASDLLSRQLIPVEPFSAIAGRVSRFLWENRALDLTGQAFVIVAAIICCMAMLKHEGAAS